ncbi:MAG: hypothetical protein RLZZ04_767 [Cyanobacteriota bacterium]
MTTSENQYEIQKTEQEWKEALTPEEFKVLRKHGTERAGTSPLDKVYDEGTYICKGCGQPLFTSDTKFNSGTGWPSFYQPLEEAIATTVDRTLFMTRTEVHCSRCGGHLGHVFNDGPKPTGQRYCMNGVSLKFVPEVFKLLGISLGWQIALVGVANPPVNAQTKVRDRSATKIQNRLDIPDQVLKESPTLQRWLKEVPDLLEDIRHDPSFRSRLRLGFTTFPSTDNAGGINVGVEDIFIKRTGLTL